jgi:hypothetical protein
MRRSVEIFNESATGCANAVQTAETAGKDLKKLQPYRTRFQTRQTSAPTPPNLFRSHRLTARKAPQIADPAATTACALLAPAAWRCLPRSAAPNCDEYDTRHRQEFQSSVLAPGSVERRASATVSLPIRVVIGDKIHPGLSSSHA